MFDGWMYSQYTPSMSVRVYCVCECAIKYSTVCVCVCVSGCVFLFVCATKPSVHHGWVWSGRLDLLGVDGLVFSVHLEDLMNYQRSGQTNNYTWRSETHSVIREGGH